MQSKNIQDLISLDGRKALITGALGGFGSEISLALAELGADLILTDRADCNQAELLSTINSISDVSVDFIPCDLEDKSSRKELIEWVIKNSEHLNILVNNAAFVGQSDLDGWNTDLHNQSLDTWKRAIEVNLTSVFDLTKNLSSKIKSSGDGSIINIASIYGTNPPDYSLYEGLDMNNPAAYSASKGGLIQLSRWFASTLAPDIRVNSISPGGVLRGQHSDFIQRYIDKTPMARMANNDDIKGVIAFLSTDLSRYITGQNVLLDGGFTLI
tara:strand:- start:43145 stop:43954 length:810 start_codon:yes stop_codon:yes gene_type:complete